MIRPDEKVWVDDLWGKIVSKMEKVAVRSYDKLPYIAANGVHDDKKEKSVNKSLEKLINTFEEQN